jgi:hypothetical protein
MKKPGLLSASGVCVLVLLPKVVRADEVPDPDLTPGLIASADTGEVCASDGRPGSAYSRAHRSMNENDRRADFARYRIAWRDHRRYEDDHLVPLCLGGADVPANRWPEPGWRRTGSRAMPARWCVQAGSLSVWRNGGFWRRPIGETLIAESSVSRNDDLTARQNGLFFPLHFRRLPPPAWRGRPRSHAPLPRGREAGSLFPRSGEPSPP